MKKFTLKQDKIASARLVEHAETLRQAAWEESGEFEHPTVLQMCEKMLELASWCEHAALIIRVDTGEETTVVNGSDIPF